MTRSVKIRLEFNGSGYIGWQSQKDSSPAVQDVLNKALCKIFKIEKAKTIGSGRTDSGVHSIDHHVKFVLPFNIGNFELLKALNSNLPKDIRVQEVVDSNIDFRPTNDALSREYRYLFTTNKIESAFQENLIVNYPFELDFETMREACQLFVGKHDFLSFSCKGSETATTIRTISSLELLKGSPDFHGILPDHYYFRIVGSGFLKQMVRLIVGSLWSVGRGKVSLDDISNALKEPGSGHLAAVAPAAGLYKIKVAYE